MVDLVKIRNKKKRNAGVPPAEQAASPPPSPEPPFPEPPPENRGQDAARSAGEDAGAPTKLEKFKADAGKRRAFESISAAEVAPESQLELLTFVMAGEQYAVDIERIVEIVTPRAVTRIPNADPSVVGIISLRGTIVTLVDVRRKLRHREAGQTTDDTRIVVIDFHREIVGFIVDRVLRVVKASAGDIERHPVVHVTELDESVRGVFRPGGALTILLDLDKLLDHGALTARTA